MGKKDRLTKLKGKGWERDLMKYNGMEQDGKGRPGIRRLWEADGG